MERRMLRYVVKVQRMEDSRLTRRVFEECWVERSWSGEEVGGSWLGVRKRLRKFVNRGGGRRCVGKGVWICINLRKLVFEDYVRSVRGRRGVSASSVGFRLR